MSCRNSVWFKIISLCVLANVIFFVFGQEILLANAIKKTIPAGTPVTVKIDQEVSSKEFPAGSKVKASVASDVVIDNVVVIRAGAPAEVTVISSRKAGAVGQAGAITLQVNSIQAVDGTKITITSASLAKTGKGALTTALVVAILCCILGLLIKGKDGVVASGTTITGYTVSSVEVSI